MAPLADAILFVFAGVLLVALRAVVPKRLRPPSVLVFAALAVFTLLLMYQPLYRPAAALLALGVGTSRFSDGPSLEPARSIQWSRGASDHDRRDSLPQPRCTCRLPQSRARHPSGKTAARTGAPDILFIVLDTVRSWNLSVYGYPRPTTPEIERWMRDGLRFEHALANASWTLPSHASMFTGRFPHELSADWLTAFDATYPTLAEVLSARVTTTAGFVANTALLQLRDRARARLLALRGLRDFPALRSCSPHRSPSFFREHGSCAASCCAKVPRRSTMRFSAGSNERQDARPYFVFLNYMDAHDPYQPPAPFDQAFPRPERRSSSKA